MLKYGSYGNGISSNRSTAYQNTDIETADRGKLVIMIYDHCIRWSKAAREAIRAGKVEDRTKAIFRVQDGLTELMCSLDFEKGGEISNNLYRLYDFYSRHLSEANIKNSEQNVEQVQKWLENLREAWVECFDKLRRQGLLSRPTASSFVSVRG